ncbi:MAG: hypothetical protein HUJ30_01015 [Gammaproteobacteria bacterium]|nr:hypothetical protein [Gammaproteobacteria bacterium]
MSRLIAVILYFGLCGAVQAGVVDANTLIKSYQKILSQQPENQYPFLLHARDDGDKNQAEIFFLLDISLDDLVNRLNTPKGWCGFIGININIKTCIYEKQHIVLYAGRKFYQPPQDAHRLRYQFSSRRDGQYFEARMFSKEGPLGTSNYRFHLAASRLQGRTLLYFFLSYEDGFLSRSAI